MKALRVSHPLRWARISPWLIIGSMSILAAILVILAIRNVQREKRHMVRTLVSEADILARSLEAISRTAMMRMGWGRNQIQFLMQEASRQPGVLYVALLTGSGQVVAHSDPEKVGTSLDFEVPRTDGIEHRFAERGQRVFEVSRPFQIRHGSGMRHFRSMHPPDVGSEFGSDIHILIGLDPTPFEAAIRHDFQQMTLLFMVLFLGGGAGFLSLMWAQSYYSVRRSLQNMEAFTSTVVNQMPMGLLATNPEGRIQRANEAARSILHAPVEPGMDIGSFPSFVPMAQELRMQETVVGEEVQHHVEDGRSVPLLANAATIRDGQDRAVGHVFLFADITHIKQLEEQLRRSERLAALGRLAAGVAHEIRNPLSSIKGFATILAGKVERDPQAHKIAGVMQQEVERLNRVITELLDFARPTELHRQPSPCRELVRNTLRLVEMDAAHQGVKIESRVNPEDIEGHVDPDRFAQVLLNLYLNALQAMEDGGTLKVDVEGRQDQVVWTVSDTGSGIEPEHLSQVFDPYFTTKPHGVGLGLAIVYKLVEAHNGEIEVASTPGQGTAFTISTPLPHPGKEEKDGETHPSVGARRG